MLFLHFFAVAFYAIWIMFTHPRRVTTIGAGGIPKEMVRRPGIEQYPLLLVKAIRVVSSPFFLFSFGRRELCLIRNVTR